MLNIGSRIDRYELVHDLGGGGMGHVYKVRHTVLGSFHALKVLNPEYMTREEIRRRFLAEGQIQAQLRHPNIAAVTDVIVDEGIAGLLMELVEGDPLEDRIGGVHPVPSTREVLEVFLPVLSALGYAHGQGIVHRDIKPANIILGRLPDGSLQPKLLDFGIAKIRADLPGGGAAKGMTRQDQAFGTPGYMSPEQIQGAANVDPRSDVFSLSATLYEYVTGTAPYDGPTEFVIMKKVVEGDHRPPRELRPDIDPVVEAAILRGLSTAPEDRFPSCEAFAEGLRGALGSPRPEHSSPIPIRIPPPPPPPSGGARTGLSIALIGCLILGGLGAVGTVGVLAGLRGCGGGEPVVVASEDRDRDRRTRDVEAQPKEEESDDGSRAEPSADHEPPERIPVAPVEPQPGDRGPDGLVVGPVWIVCAGAFPTREKAEDRAAELRAASFDADVLWIPDYGSLSGAKYWLAYTGSLPYDDRRGAEEMLADVRGSMPDAYAIKLDRKGPRETIR